jgi:hypothetical protein
LLLQLGTPLPVANLPTVVPPDPQFAPSEREDVSNLALSFPERTTTPRGLDADFVNLAFVGSSAQIADAFQAAGWKRSEAMSRQVAFREINAFLMLRNYPHGPISRQLLQGEPSDSSWEKGVDSIAKRDHLRIWSTPETWKGEPVWLSASTRDVGARLSIRKRRFVHIVDPNIDEERERVVRDLTLAGCVDAVDEVSRPAVPHFAFNGTGGAMTTAIVKLRECSHPLFNDDPAAPEIAARPSSGFVRYVRTQVLSGRDLWRENPVYDAFSATRASVRAIRTARARHENREERAALSAPVTEAKP